MKPTARWIWCAILGCMISAAAHAAATRTEIVQRDGKWQLIRDGQPYFIKGAGGGASKQLLASLGGNSFRTWGTDGLDEQLEEARKLSLSVTVGIWLEHEGKKFNYDNADQVAAQYERARQTILKYKDHPCVLAWGIGNEMEGYKTGDKAAIWTAVNAIAVLAKQLDPNHPTMSVIAEIGGARVR
ncbi:MAG TPA: glycoside hydrolase family 2 TIM barrel-domain containing protein, partial [Tepidisphaeraceae bacterium]|nr:glycoside hydrolase family 2 TIM barrel-domain containing protein [Tepidisphaeraceae bacterium]